MNGPLLGSNEINKPIQIKFLKQNVLEEAEFSLLDCDWDYVTLTAGQTRPIVVGWVLVGILGTCYECLYGQMNGWVARMDTKLWVFQSVTILERIY